MSVGIFKNGKYNKVAGNAKDSTAANTTYNNGTSGLQANNVQSAIDELDSTVDTLNSNLNHVFNDLSFTVWTTTSEQKHSIKGNYFLYFLANNSKQLIEYGIFISNSKIVLQGNDVLSLSISNNVLEYKSNSSTGYLSIISMP